MLWWPGLNACHVDVVLLKDTQRVVKAARLVRECKQDCSSVIALPELNFFANRVSARFAFHTHHAPEVSDRWSFA